MDATALKQSPLWRHLTAVLGNLLMERPEDPIHLFERVSNYVAQGKLVPDVDRKAQYEGKGKRLVKLQQHPSTEWAQKFVHHVYPPAKEKKPAEDGEAEPEEEEEVPEDKGQLPDILAEASAFQWCGVGLVEAEAYRVMIGLKRLLDKEPLASIRFWGKIYGTRNDYLIAEAEVDPDRVQEEEEAAGGDAEGEEGEEAPKANILHKGKPPPVVPPEAKGTGSNKYVYYVATAPELTQWTKLPDLVPGWVVAARVIKTYFTGDLDAPVAAHPPFPGVERHYLRAQIARITHSCTVAPRLMFSLTDPPAAEEEEEGAEKKKKRYTVDAWEEIPEITPTEPPAEDDEEAVNFAVWTQGFPDDALLQLDNWVHFLPALLQSQGRASLWKPEEEEDEETGDGDAEVEKPPPPPPEQIPPRLGDLAHDRKLRFPHHSQPAFAPWTVRKAFPLLSSGQSLYLLSSLLWPGAYTFAKTQDGVRGATYANIYIGHGVKRDSRAHLFAPRLPKFQTQEYRAPTTAILQLDATPDDELEFAKPPPPPENAEGEDEDADAEEEED